MAGPRRRQAGIRFGTEDRMFERLNEVAARLRTSRSGVLRGLLSTFLDAYEQMELNLGRGRTRETEQRRRAAIAAREAVHEVLGRTGVDGEG